MIARTAVVCHHAICTESSIERTVGIEPQKHGVEGRAATDFTGDEEGLSLPVAKADEIYPEDYIFPPCEPDVELDGGETFTFGDLNIQVIHTPGHSPDSMCYLADIKGKRCLFSGDVVLHDGLLLFLNCPGTTMEGFRNSMPKLANLGIEALMPGHGPFVLNTGQEHVDKAIEALKHLAPPPGMW